MNKSSVKIKKFLPFYKSFDMTDDNNWYLHVRCAVASRDIEAGEIVIEDEAAMVAPGGGQFVCLECAAPCPPESRVFKYIYQQSQQILMMS